MRFGSLFSGIGGLDLGLERAGMEVAWQVENDPYCVQVLAKHWPDVPRFGDIRSLTGDELESVDLICGGFPCQPTSYAGKGLAQADERWLWPEFARVVGVLRPGHVLVENPPGLLTRGFGDVLADLAAVGYDAEWDCIPAAFFGAPHIRYRIILVAHAQGVGGQIWPTEAQREGGSPGRRADVPDAHQQRGQLPAEGRFTAEQEPGRDGASRGAGRPCLDARSGRHGPPEGEVPAGRDGFVDSNWWAVEPDVGRVADGVPNRVDRLRGLGNAVVPQVAEWIGTQLIAHLRAKSGRVEGQLG